jgi:hypothetical protein
MLAIRTARKFLTENCRREDQIKSWNDWLGFKRESLQKEWVYLYYWKVPGFFAWGTTSKSNDRVRKAGLFHDTPSGKYDRRVDYLIARKLYGMPRCFVFETLMGHRATKVEKALKEIIQPGIAHCFHGLPGNTRREITDYFLSSLRESEHYQAAPDNIRVDWEQYVTTVYLVSRSPFKFGDTLEPNHLRKIGSDHLVPAIRYMLDLSEKYQG